MCKTCTNSSGLEEQPELFLSMIMKAEGVEWGRVSSIKAIGRTRMKHTHTLSLKKKKTHPERLLSIYNQR